VPDGITRKQLFSLGKRILGQLKLIAENSRKPVAVISSAAGAAAAISPTQIDLTPLISFSNSDSTATALGGAAVSTSILAARPERKYLRISLVGAVVVNCSVDQPAVVNRGVKITTATNNPAAWEPKPVPVGEIFAINAVAGGIMSVIEGF